ncbi:hypothetical protein C8Q77DRAFT_1074562 [Trametes polyzona]|nr:hypothetical protein C8Q77DRAFT_1074562 [Trametes polyzona]
MAESMATFQNAFYIGNNFNAILYGVELVLYFLTIRAMLATKRQQTRTEHLRSRHRHAFLMFFGTVLLCLNTVFVATEAVFGEEMWIVHAAYPGGQDAYLGDFASVWYQTLGTAASIVLNLLSDGFFVYRCYVVWGRDNAAVIIFPVLLYLGAFCTSSAVTRSRVDRTASLMVYPLIAAGLAQLVESGRPHANYFAGLAHQLGVAYTSCVISLNVLTSSLICGKIVRDSRRSAAAAGVAISPECVTVTATVVESAALYSLTGIAYVVSFAMNSQTSVFFLSIYVMMTCIAPQMMLLRVASGRALSHAHPSTQTGTGIVFGPGASQSSTGTGSATDMECGDESSLKHMHQSGMLSTQQLGTSEATIAVAETV